MNMDKFFNPDSMAVVGASRTVGKVGNTVVKNLKENFPGKIYPVNPKADEIAGLKCYSSVKDIEEVPDSVVVAVPAEIANKVVKQCSEIGVPSVTLLTSGYEEIGEKGKKLQAELESVVESSDTRLIGPNCLGIKDMVSGVDSMFIPGYKLEEPPEGDIAIISQSGAVGSAVLDLFADRNIGVSRFVSYGNQLDVSETDLLEWLKEDDETEAVAVYMEGVKDGEEFLEKVEKVSMENPVVVLKAGKTEQGSKAAVSHTGALAGSYQVYKGVFQKTGVVEAETMEDLFNYVKILGKEEKPDGNRVAVVTNGGGFGVIATDAIAETDLELAEFSEDTEEKLGSIIKSYGNVGNPMDVIGDADPETYNKALEAIVNDDNVDMVVCISLMQTGPMESTIADIIEDYNENSGIPIVGCMIGGKYTQLHSKYLEKNGVPMFSDPKEVAEALNQFYLYHRWKERRE